MNALAFTKNKPIDPATEPEPAHANPLTAATTPTGEKLGGRGRPPARQPAAVIEQPECAGGEEQPHDLGLRERGHRADAGGDRPQQRVGLVRGARELVRGDRDDRQHRRADTEEDLMHDREPLVLRVEDRNGGHQQARRQHERQRDRGRAERTGLQVPEPHRQLRGERTGHRLREREPLAVLAVR